MGTGAAGKASQGAKKWPALLRRPSEAVGRAGSPAGGHAWDAWPCGCVWVLCGGLPLVCWRQPSAGRRSSSKTATAADTPATGGGAPQRGGAPAQPTAREARTTPPTRPPAATGAPRTTGAAMARSAGVATTQGIAATPGIAAAPAAPPTPRVGARPPEPAAPGRGLGTKRATGPTNRVLTAAKAAANTPGGAAARRDGRKRSWGFGVGALRWLRARPQKAATAFDLQERAEPQGPCEDGEPGRDRSSPVGGVPWIRGTSKQRREPAGGTAQPIRAQR